MSDKQPEIKLPEIPRVSLPTIERIREINENVRESIRGLDQLMDVVRNNRKAIQDAVAGLNKAWQPAIQLVQSLGRLSAAKEPLQQRGILSHRSTPWDLFKADAAEDFPDAVLDFYEHQWDRAEAVFMSDIDSYLIGDDAKDAFMEAIQCHRRGLFRASVLTLLPAVEMEFRRAFEIGPGVQAVNLEELRKAVMEAPAGVLLIHVAPLHLFEILDEHTYERVKTQEDVDRLSRDPIPNRHAAIHGLLIYKTRLNSLNALIIADYVFFLISQLSGLAARKDR